MPPLLHFNRPTLLLASICLLRLHTQLTPEQIATLLHANFPDYAPWPSADDILRMYQDVSAAHPEWIAGLHRADTHRADRHTSTDSHRDDGHRDEIEQMLSLVRSEGLSRSDRFPRDSRGAREAWVYLQYLIART